MREYQLGDFGQMGTKPSPRRVPATPTRQASFFENVTNRIKDDYSKIDKKLNNILFPTGDYIKPSTNNVISKGGMSHLKRTPAVNPIPPSNIIIPAAAIVSNSAVSAKTIQQQSAPISPIAKAGIAAAVIGAGYFFLKD
jgi:hypothetical protein